MGEADGSGVEGAADIVGELVGAEEGMEDGKIEGSKELDGANDTEGLPLGMVVFVG